jgi:hypothetical protein
LDGCQPDAGIHRSRRTRSPTGPCGSSPAARRLGADAVRVRLGGPASRSRSRAAGVVPAVDVAEDRSLGVGAGKAGEPQPGRPTWKE